MSNEEIHQICQQYNIENYTINPDGSIDVEGNVDLSQRILMTSFLYLMRILI